MFLILWISMTFPRLEIQYLNKLFRVFVFLFTALVSQGGVSLHKKTICEKRNRFLQVFNYFHLCLCSFLLKQKTMKRHIFISILVLGRIFDSKDCRFTFEVKIRFIHIYTHWEKESNCAQIYFCLR